MITTSQYSASSLGTPPFLAEIVYQSDGNPSVHSIVLVVLVAFRYSSELRFLGPHFARLHIVYQLLGLPTSGGSGCLCLLMGLCGSSNSTLGVWLVLEYLADAYGLSLVSQSESSHLLNGFEFLKSNWGLGSDTSDYSRLTPGELWFMLFGDFSSVVCLV